MSGFVVWFTGLSGAGKSTLGALLAAELRGRGQHVEVLDGDEVRTHLSKGLGFSREDRDTNVRRIGFVAKLVARSGAVAITGAISPFRSIRDEQRAAIGRFVEVYCCSSIEALAARDPKGLYRKALAGEIKGFSGIDDPYEAPETPELVVYTDCETKEESLAKIVGKLEELGYVPRSAGVFTKQPASSLAPPHGGELVLRRVMGERRDKLAERAKSLPVLDLDAEAEMDLDLLASGALSPLKGFLGSKDWLRVAREMRLENGLPWPLPVTLPVTEEAARALGRHQEAALRARDGRLVAVLEVSDVFRPDDLFRGRSLMGPLGGDDPEMLRQTARGPVLVGGEVFVIEPHVSAEASFVEAPAQTRARLASLGLDAVAAMRTRGLPTRAAEHYARTALELVGGLFLQVLASTDAPGAAGLPLRLRGHEALVEFYFPSARVALSVGLEPRRAGARAAVLDAIVGQNHGCSHVVVWGSSCPGGVAGAERAFRVYAPGELWARPLCFEDAFFSARTGSMVSARSAPSGPRANLPTEAEMLERLAETPPELFRPEVALALTSASPPARA